MHCYCHLQREGSAAVAACGLTVLRTRCVCVMRYLQVNRQARKTKDITYLCVRLLSSSSSYSGHSYSGHGTCLSWTSAKVFLLKYLSCLHVLPAFYCKSISIKLFTQCFCCPTVRACVACLKRLATKWCDYLPSLSLSLIALTTRIIQSAHLASRVCHEKITRKCLASFITCPEPLLLRHP